MSSPPPLTPLAAAVLHVARPERILQVACGDGEGALFLAREFPTARVRGIDADANLVAAASRRVGLDPEGRVAFKLGGPRRIPYPDDNFELVAVL
ncbi:MAG TPA: class I SAM-dependent methyltransferase, partial [Solirubrobacterales bacterium]